MRVKIAGIIPARWGSTRFPGKPLHPIAGKALLRHVWERARQARELATVIIATDDMRIAEAAFDWGAEVALTSQKMRSGTDRVAAVIAHAPEITHVINIQGDEPLVEPKLIDRLAREMKGDQTVEMVTAAHPFKSAAEVESPHQVKVVCDRAGDALYFSRAPIPHMSRRSHKSHLRHQGIYGYTRELLARFVSWKPSPLERAESLEQLRALENGVRIRVIVTGGGWPGVDTPADADAVERALLRRAGNSPRRKTKARR